MTRKHGKKKGLGAFETIDETELLSLGGFACLFFWHLTLLLWIIPCFASPEEAFSLQFAYLLGMSCATVAAPVLTKIARFKHIFLLDFTVAVFCLVACLFPLLSLVLPLNETTFPSFFAALVLSGGIAVYFFTLFENIGSRIRLASTLSFVPFALCIGCLSFAACRFTLASNGAMLSIFAITASGGLALYISKKTPQGNSSIASSVATHHLKENLKITFLFGIIGVGFGFAWAMIIQEPFWWLAAMSLGAIVGLAILKITKPVFFEINIGSLERFSAGVMATAFMIASLSPDTKLSLACFSCLIFLWAIFRMLNGGLLLRFAIESEFSTTHYLATGKICTHFGILIGFCIGWILFFTLISTRAS